MNRTLCPDPIKRHLHPLPSLKTLMAGLRINTQAAHMLRLAMARNKGLRFANALLGGYGVEAIHLPDGCINNCRAPELTIRYANMGDTYTTTLLKVAGRYRVGNWGDVVEAYDARHGRHG